MAKKAKSNIYCGGKYYLQGKLYSTKEVIGLDPNDFEDIADEVLDAEPVEVVEEEVKTEEEIEEESPVDIVDEEASEKPSSFLGNMFGK